MRLKIASHIHSSWSDDSTWSLSSIVRLLRRCGFDGALVCDHDRTMTETRRQMLVQECSEMSDQHFTLVPGVEYQDQDHIVHVPVFGDVPFFGRSPDTSELLDHANDHDAVALFAHPARRDAWARFEPGWADRLQGIEVWSRKYDGISLNRWASATSASHAIAPWVSLDFHGPRQLFPLAMRIDVTDRSAEAILATMRKGAVATGFGIPLSSPFWERGTRLLDRAESARSRLAPVARRLENQLRRASSHTRRPIDSPPTSHGDRDRDQSA